MKEVKKKEVMQELSKEEAAKTYGGRKASLAFVVAEGGKIAIVVA